MKKKKKVNDLKLFNEENLVNVGLSPREIELILLLINDVASIDPGLNGMPVYSADELNLVKKLETALEKEITQISIMPGFISEYKH